MGGKINVPASLAKQIRFRRTMELYGSSLLSLLRGSFNPESALSFSRFSFPFFVYGKKLFRSMDFPAATLAPIEREAALRYDFSC